MWMTYKWQVYISKSCRTSWDGVSIQHPIPWSGQYVFRVNLFVHAGHQK